MNAEVATIKTAAETALAHAFAQARDAAARRRRDCGAARSGLRRVRQGRPAASPHRGLEIHRPARADARGKAACRPPDAAAKARGEDAGALLGDVEARRLVFVDGAFVPELSDIANLEPGLAVRSLADALAGGDPALAAHLGKLAPASDVAVALNTALMGDGAVIRIAAGATIERPLHLLFVASEKPAATFRALAGRRRRRAPAPC